MQALCLMHKLDPDSCLRVDLNESFDSQEYGENGRVQLMQDM